MSANKITGLARRPFLGAIAGVFAVAIAAGAVYEWPLNFRRRYPKTPFDDLLDRLPDRESAVRVGHAALGVGPAFHPQQAAKGLRSQFDSGPLSDVVLADAANHHMVEIKGWVLPTGLVLLCELAASAA